MGRVKRSVMRKRTVARVNLVDARQALASTRSSSSEPPKPGRVSGRLYCTALKRIRQLETENRRLRADKRVLIHEKRDLLVQRDNKTRQISRVRSSAQADRAADATAAAAERQQLDDQNAMLRQELSQASLEAGQLRRRLKALASELRSVRRSTEAATARAVRKAVRAATTFDMRDPESRNIYAYPSRELFRDLYALHVTAEAIPAVINTVCDAAGVLVKGDPSDRTVRRAIVEGGVGSELHMVSEMQEAQCGLTPSYCCPLCACIDLLPALVLSSDGTTRKCLNYQSHHVVVTRPDGTWQTFFAGMLRPPNHTTKTQFNDWVDTIITKRIEFFNSTAEGALRCFAVFQFASKVKALMTDHANDQKALYREFEVWLLHLKRRALGYLALCLKTAHAHAELICNATSALLAAHGGPIGWQLLSEDEHRRLLVTMYDAIYDELGQARFDSMSDVQQFTIEFLVHTCCGMHKELNMVGGANQAMMLVWQIHGFTPPIELLNKDAKKAKDAGAVFEGSRAGKLSRGGVKAAQLWGMLFKNNDPKKGYQDRFLVWASSEHSLNLTLPDVNNVRFGCYTGAATFLLLHLDITIEFMEHVRDTKAAGSTFTNVETNVFNALDDDPTLHELAGLAYVGECISIPYMEHIRTPGVNALELGPFNAQAQKLCRTIAYNPDLVIAPYREDMHLQASLDGRPFRNPAVFHRIQALLSSGRLQYEILFRIVFAAFTGAAETLERFCEEYKAGGKISRAAPELLKSVFVPATNDANEGKIADHGAFGRRAPGARLEFFNAATMYKQNKSRASLRRLSGATQRLLMSETRRREKLHLEKHDKLRRSQHERQQRQLKLRKRAAALKRKSEHEKKLDAVELSLFRSGAALPPARTLTVARIRDEIAWHKHRGVKDAWPSDAKAVSSAVKAKLYAWLSAILAYWDSHPDARPPLPIAATSSGPPPDVAGGELEAPGDDNHDLDEEEEMELVGL